jgi:hypothetical protein
VCAVIYYAQSLRLGGGGESLAGLVVVRDGGAGLARPGRLLTGREWSGAVGPLAFGSHFLGIPLFPRVPLPCLIPGFPGFSGPQEIWARIPWGLLIPCWLAGVRVLLGLVLVYSVSFLATVDESSRLKERTCRVKEEEID